jgi:hypothetical protein
MVDAVLHYLATHIWWGGFSWEAFTTLMAGAAAVIGAIYIGREQVKIAREQAQIAREQAKIAAQQTDIQDQMLKAALYDKREEVMVATTAFIASASVNKTVPDKLQEEFTIAVGKAAFLFDGQTVDRLRGIQNIYLTIQEALEAIDLDEMEHGEGRAEDFRKYRQARRMMQEKISEIKDIFPEMVMGRRM